MESVEQAFCEARFLSLYLQSKADEFQDLFCRIMALRYPGDFMRFRPWGPRGDQKNDGYLPSQRTLFQVYAPNEMEESETIQKINKDFEGALPYWEKYFDKWVFVHNSLNGLGPNQGRALLELHEKYPHIQIADWGYEALLNELLQLDDTSLVSILGPGRAPANFHMSQIRYEHIKFVLHSISQQPPDIDQDLRPVPLEKLSTNNLSDRAVVLLNAGMTRAQLVENFFRDYIIDPTLGEGLATTFRQWYAELRDEKKSPDEIFLILHARVGGGSYSTPELEGAALAVLAYYFEKCDIFERPD